MIHATMWILDHYTRVTKVPGGLLFIARHIAGSTSGAAGALQFVPCSMEEAEKYLAPLQMAG